VQGAADRGGARQADGAGQLAVARQALPNAGSARRVKGAADQLGRRREPRVGQEAAQRRRPVGGVRHGAPPSAGAGWTREKTTRERPKGLRTTSNRTRPSSTSSCRSSRQVWFVTAVSRTFWTSSLQVIPLRDRPRA